VKLSGINFTYNYLLFFKLPKFCIILLWFC